MGKKKTVSISVDEDLLKWIDQQIEIKRFAQRSHAFEYAIEQLRSA
jgi:metal-responsive CopG/Arc/MetJ family transcriptional regulator